MEWMEIRILGEMRWHIDVDVDACIKGIEDIAGIGLIGLAVQEGSE